MCVCAGRGEGAGDGGGVSAAAVQGNDFSIISPCSAGWGGVIFRKGAPLVPTGGLLWMKNSYGPNFLQGLGNMATNDRCISYFFGRRAR